MVNSTRFKTGMKYKICIPLHGDIINVFNGTALAQILFWLLLLWFDISRDDELKVLEGHSPVSNVLCLFYCRY